MKLHSKCKGSKRCFFFLRDSIEEPFLVPQRTFQQSTVLKITCVCVCVKNFLTIQSTFYHYKYSFVGR